MINSLLQQLGQSLTQWVNSPSGKNAIRYAVHTAVSREIPRWYNNLSHEEQERVDAITVWAIKKALVVSANCYGGLVVGVIVEKAVELAMEKLHENDENARNDIQALIEKKVSGGFIEANQSSVLESSDLGSGSLPIESSEKHVKTGSWINGRFTEVKTSSKSTPNTASSLDIFHDYEAYLRWFKGDFPKMEPLSKKKFYLSLRYKET
jgi:hypothetical protein